jgi:hypothetical protein
MIRPSDEADMLFWSEKLGCSVARLRAAIKRAGPLVANVRQYLRSG